MQTLKGCTHGRTVIRQGEELGRQQVVGWGWGWAEAGRCDREILMEERRGKHSRGTLPPIHWTEKLKPGTADAGARQSASRASRCWMLCDNIALSPAWTRLILLPGREPRGAGPQPEAVRQVLNPGSDFQEAAQEAETARFRGQAAWGSGPMWPGTYSPSGGLARTTSSSEPASSSIKCGQECCHPPCRIS